MKKYLMIIIAITILFEFSCKKKDNSVTPPCSIADNSFSGTGVIGQGTLDTVFGGAIGATYVIHSPVTGIPNSYIEISFVNPVISGIDTILPGLVLISEHPHAAGIKFVRDSILEYGLVFQNVYVNVSGNKITATVCDLLMTNLNNMDTLTMSCKVIKE